MTNRINETDQTQIIEFKMQNYSVFIVKSLNMLATVETNYMYFLTQRFYTIGGHSFENLVDYHSTVVPDDLWSYVLESHVQHVMEIDDQFLESMMFEIDDLIS